MGIVDDGADKGRVERMDAAFTLYQFHHDSADVILFSQGLDRFEVIRFGVDEAVQEGAEILMELILAAGVSVAIVRPWKLFFSVMIV